MGRIDAHPEAEKNLPIDPDASVEISIGSDARFGFHQPWLTGAGLDLRMVDYSAEFIYLTPFPKQALITQGDQGMAPLWTEIIDFEIPSTPVNISFGPDADKLSPLDPDADLELKMGQDASRQVRSQPDRTIQLPIPQDAPKESELEEQPADKELSFGTDARTTIEIDPDEP